MATLPVRAQAYTHIVKLTLDAFRVAQQSSAAAAEGIATVSPAVLHIVSERERELDTLDRDVDDLVTAAINKSVDEEAREMLACLKFCLGLERIGDLLLSFSNRAGTVGRQLEEEDMRDLTRMASRLEHMITDAELSWRERNLDRAVSVLRSDAEMDRLCNVVIFRHLEPADGVRRGESFHVLFMAQELERAGDHVKNIAEEVCHLISGRSVRHVLRRYDRPVEQLFLDHLRRQEAK
jgi:phosphate transport system protein